jgi:hypothetical protein
MRKAISMLPAAIVLVAATALAQGAKLTFQWDPNPASDQVTKYTLYERQPSGPVKVADIQPGVCTATVCEFQLQNVAPGVHTYYLTASNMWGESAPSNDVSTPPRAAAPANIRITITITIGP